MSPLSTAMLQPALYGAALDNFALDNSALTALDNFALDSTVGHYHVAAHYNTLDPADSTTHSRLEHYDQNCTA